MEINANHQGGDECLTDFEPWPEWILKRKGGKVLSSPGALTWFCRKHRRRLVESGQLILRNGPGGHYVGPHFADIVLEILREESAANV